jgi:hypothetical protein
MGPLSIEENDDVRGGIAQGPDPIGKAGPEQVGIEPVDHVVERVMGLQATIIGQSAAGNRVVVRPVARSSAESSCPRRSRKAPATGSQAGNREPANAREDQPALKNRPEPKRTVEIATPGAPNHRSDR